MIYHTWDEFSDHNITEVVPKILYKATYYISYKFHFIQKIILSALCNQLTEWPLISYVL
jgi:hypothetical protein